MIPSEHSRRLLKMLQQIAPESRIEKLTESLEAGGGGEERELGNLDAMRSFRDDESIALETLDSLTRDGIDSPLTNVQQEALEAIVLPRYRPVVNIVNDTFAAPPNPWEHLGTGLPRQRIDAAIKSIGRIEVPKHPRLIPYAGTGFVVGKRARGGHLLMTNRHVAELFATGLGQRSLTFHPGQQVAVDFKREVFPTPPQLLTVESVVMIHPYWDMALLGVAGLPDNTPVLSLSTEDPSAMAERDVVVIGYPAQDWRNNLDLQNRIFGGIFEVKRMQPGKLKERRDFESYGRMVNAITHDSSTLGGNSGSAVIEFSDTDEAAPARVTGLHFAGEYLKANYAVSTFDLAHDSRVVDAGVNFVGRVDPRKDFYGSIWQRADNGETAALPGGEDSSAATQRLDGGGTAPISVSPSSANWMIPIHVSIVLGTPTLAAYTAVTVPGTAPAQPAEGIFGRRAATMPVDAMERFSADSLLETQFSWPTALSLAVSSLLAYDSRASVENTARNVWQLQSCEFIEADDTQCFVASSDRAVLVAFRGTETLGDWLADLNVLKTDRPYGTVHRGFRNAFAVVDSQLRAALSGQTGKPVLITGHSLGGALAMIAASEWQGTFPISWVYTYGQPCVGRGNFVAFMLQHYRGKLVRFVNDDDIVPRVPPTYRHVGRLIHFDPAGNVQAAAESFATEAPPTADPPPLTEAEFDQLRAQLLAERSRRRSGGATELLAGPAAEGLFPSFSDHSLQRYLVKIMAKSDT